MKKKRKAASPEREAGFPLAPGIATIAAVLLLLFAAAFAMLGRAGMLPDYLRGIFATSEEKTDDSASSPGAIRLAGDEGNGFSDENFFTPDFSEVARDREKLTEVLQSIDACVRYRQILAVDFGEETDTVTILRDGDKYRVESKEKLVVCDGETVYLRMEPDDGLSYERVWSVAEGRFRFEDETGLSSLTEIVAKLEASPTAADCSYNETDKVIALDGVMDAEASRSYGISFETGIVLFESAVTTENEILFRRYTLSYTVDPDFDEDAFVVPQLETTE